MKANDFMYKNDAGKDVCGAAAFNHYVFTECGGIDGFVEKYKVSVVFKTYAKSRSLK
jgi:hypothetical protein